MPSGKDPSVKKVRPTVLKDEEPEEPEEKQRPLRSPRRSQPEPRPKLKSKPWEEVELAETRVAMPVDVSKSKDKDDPAERLGMSKIGPTKGIPLGEPSEDESPEEPLEEPPVPEPIIEEAIQEDDPHEELTETMEDEPEDAFPRGKLPPPPIPPGKKGKTVEPPKPPKEEPGEVELEEVEVNQGGRTVKIMRVKPTAPPPSDEEEEPLDDPATAAAFGLQPGMVRPKGEKGPPTRGGIRELSDKDEGSVRRPGRAERIKHSAGLGVEVDLDKETIRKLSAPVLPAEFNYPTRAFYSRFSRYVLFMVLPVLFLFMFYLLKLVTPLTIFLVVMLIIVMLFVLMIYGISPFYTSHWVTKQAVLLKHGYYFDARIPLAEIRSVKVYEERAGMLGIRLDRGRRLFALSDRKDMVELVLRMPMSVAKFKNIESVVTNVEAPATFVKTVRSAMAAMIEEPDHIDEDALQDVHETDSMED